jgi:hypothetical protein
MMLLFEECGKCGYLRGELCETFRRIFDKFLEPFRVEVMGVDIANDMAEFPKIVEDSPI